MRDEVTGSILVGRQIVERAMPAPARSLSERQIEAVYAVMRLLRDDEAAPAASEEICCAACQRSRSGRGSVTYGENLLCNGCATDYELLSAARRVRSVEEFVRASGGI